MPEKTIGLKLRSPETKVALISLAHGINDMYAGFLSTFLPFIKENLGLSYALAGSFNVIVGIFHVICQPVIGYLCDRMSRPFLMMAGPFLCGLGAVMLPNTNFYGMALFFAGLWGLGSAIFHSQGTGGVGYVSNVEHLRRSLTWYNVVGSIGSAFSPFIAVAIVKNFGYQWLPAALLPTLLLAPLIYFSMPVLREKPSQKDQNKGFFKTIASLFTVLYPILGFSLIREVLFLCMRFSLPMKIAAQGGNLETVGTIVFCLSVGSTLSMIPMERIARRYGGKNALKGSVLTCSCILLTAAFTANTFSIVLYILGTACIYSTASLTTAMAQTLAPTERSAASTIVMGLSWGFGNILMSPFGKLADLVGIEATFIFLALLPILSMPLFFTSPFKMLKN